MMLFGFASVLAFVLTLSACGVTVRAQAENFPDTFSLPNGFRPEGVVAGIGGDIYVSCTRGQQVGSIWKGNVRTGKGYSLVDSTGDPTRGISLDKQGRLWVAWIFGARVYDSDSGRLLKQYDFVSDSAVINDVIFTGKYVIFTDSGASIPNSRGETGLPRLFVVDLSTSPANELPSTATEVQLFADFDLDTFSPTLNGIETVPGDRSKVVVCHTNLGILVLIDVLTGETTKVDVGETGPTPFSTCDGLVRRGKTLYVVRNRDIIVSEVKLDKGGQSGTIEQEYDLTTLIQDPNLDTPTTGALFGDYLYMPDSRFRLDCNSVDCDTAPFSVYRIKV